MISIHKWFITITVKTDSYLTEDDKYNYIEIEGHNNTQNYYLRRCVYNLGWFDKVRNKTLVDKIIESVRAMRQDIMDITESDNEIDIEFKEFSSAVEQAKFILGDDLYI